MQTEQRRWAGTSPQAGGNKAVREGDSQEQSVVEAEGLDQLRGNGEQDERRHKCPRCFSEKRLLSWSSVGDLRVRVLENLSPAGRDASRAFVTGDHSEAGLVDDVSDLSFSEVLTLQNWLAFYEKNYEFVGRYPTGHFRRFHSVVLQGFFVFVF